jgi:hypothetical protein
MIRRILGLAVLSVIASLCVCRTGEAQIASPRAIQFESPDHNSSLNKPLSYGVDFFAEGATAPTQSPSVAATAVAPVPGSTPQRYEISFAQLTSYPAGQVFTVKVRAVNAAGSSDASSASDPFGKPGRPAPPSRPSLVQ